MHLMPLHSETELCFQGTGHLADELLFLLRELGILHDAKAALADQVMVVLLLRNVLGKLIASTPVTELKALDDFRLSKQGQGPIHCGEPYLGVSGVQFAVDLVSRQRALCLVEHFQNVATRTGDSSSKSFEHVCPVVAIVPVGHSEPY